MEENVTFFSTPEQFEKWLELNHKTVPELWVGFHKKASGLPSITWPESVKTAICFGWIDGLRKSIHDTSYKIRFTPRRKDSIWSKRNIQYADELIKNKEMRPAGLAAYNVRSSNRSGIYSFEQEKEKVLDPVNIKLFKKIPKAWEHFNAMAPYYKRAAIHWVLSAKQEKTRNKRLNILINCSQGNLKIPPLRRKGE